MSTQTLSRLVLKNDISPSLTVFALCSVKTEHSIRMRDALSEAKRDKKLASGALVRCENETQHKNERCFI